ncbi:MAG: response regulator [Salaquimonas sp.]
MANNNNSISRILSRWAVSVAIALGIFTSIIEATFDYFDEVKKVDLLSKDILLAAKPSAGEATYQIDTTLAEEVLRGIFTYNFIRSTKIVDDFDKELASSSRNHSDTGSEIGKYLFGEIYNSYQIDLENPDKTRKTGYLQIVVDKNIALGDFYKRSIFNLLIGCLKNALLLLVLFFLFSRFIDRPLISLISNIEKVNPKKPEPISFVIDTDDSENEIRKLEGATNRLLLASQQHVADLVETQHKLQMNELKLNDFAVAASDWFWEIDHQRKIVSVSDRFFELSGRRKEDIIGRTIEKVAPMDESNLAEFKKLRQFIGRQLPFREKSMSINRADGSIIYASVSGIPYYLEDGSFGGYRGIGTDKSRLVRSEKERLRLSEDLQHSQKLRAIGQLSGGISHDFNNLLAVIMGNLELVTLEKNLSKKASGYLKMAIDASSRGAQLTRRLLAYSRQQPLSPEAIKPESLLYSLEDMLHRTIGEHIEIEFIVGGGLWRCQADPQELETVILNLAINARDAMPKGGKLTIEAFNAQLEYEKEDSQDGVQPGQYVCFGLTDTGMGMDNSTLERAFEPYFTTKPTGVGTGLGLSMAFGFAKQSNGHIKIGSKLGKGTTVKLFLPRTMEHVEDRDQDIGVVLDSKKLEKLKVLLVEDQDDVRHSVRSQLEHLGCKVTDVDNSTAALVKCQENDNYDVILLDVVLPDLLNGTDLSDALLEVSPDSKVIFMSGYTDEPIVKKGQSEVSARLLQKPFTSIELASAMINVLGKTK